MGTAAEQQIRSALDASAAARAGAASRPRDETVDLPVAGEHEDLAIGVAPEGIDATLELIAEPAVVHEPGHAAAAVPAEGADERVHRVREEVRAGESGHAAAAVDQAAGERGRARGE